MDQPTHKATIKSQLFQFCRSPRSLFSALAVLALIVPPLSAWGQALQTPREEMWVTDGDVYTIVTRDDTVYIGGTFTYVGPPTDRYVPLDRTSGSPIEPFPRVRGTVNVIAPDGSGGWYIGGTFNRVGDFQRTKIARIRSDGTVDPDFLAVNSLSPDPDFNLADGSVHAIAVSPDGSTVYAGGRYPSIGGQTRNGLAALDATTGDALAWDPDPGGLSSFLDFPVLALSVSADGTVVYAGGQFTTIGGESRNRVAALDATTAQATSWDPNIGSFSFPM